MRREFPAPVGASPHIREKYPPPTGMGTGVNFHPVHASLLWEISSYLFPLFRFQLEKNLHPHFFLLDFSWIVLCNLCIVKVVLYELAKL